MVMETMNSEFSFFKSGDLTETLNFLGQMVKQNQGAHLIAGGTNILVDIRQGTVKPACLIDIGAIPELRKIEETEGTVKLGGSVTLHEIIKSRLLKECCDFLVNAAQSVGSPQVRNRATVGGNIISASPAADMVPPLMALGAEVVLQGENSTRAVPLEHFMKGPKLTDRKSNEILVSVNFKRLEKEQKGIFFKLGKRNSMAVSIVNLSIVVTPSRDNSFLKDIRIAMGAIGPLALRMVEAEKILLSGPISEERIVKAAEAASAMSQPISDIRGSKEYRRSMVKRCLKEQLSKLLISR
jgi:CO/xanthine dehydrogenase FAD-binding subunit